MKFSTLNFLSLSFYLFKSACIPASRRQVVDAGLAHYSWLVLTAHDLCGVRSNFNFLILIVAESTQRVGRISEPTIWHTGDILKIIEASSTYDIFESVQ